jgi:hypothetical protein
MLLLYMYPIIKSTQTKTMTYVLTLLNGERLLLQNEEKNVIIPQCLLSRFSNDEWHLRSSDEGLLYAYLGFSETFIM